MELGRIRVGISGPGSIAIGRLAVAPDSDLGFALDRSLVRGIPGAIRLVTTGLVLAILDTRRIVAKFSGHARRRLWDQRKRQRL